MVTKIPGVTGLRLVRVETPKANATKQVIEPRTLARVIVAALRSDYVPIFTRPDQQEMADAFDYAMVEAGLLRRARRGLAAVRP